MWGNETGCFGAQSIKTAHMWLCVAYTEYTYKINDFNRNNCTQRHHVS